MIFNALISVFKTRNLVDKKSAKEVSRNKYIIEKYHERSVTNRYFK